MRAVAYSIVVTCDTTGLTDELCWQSTHHPAFCISELLGYRTLNTAGEYVSHDNSTRGGQKVLSLATFRYTFGWTNVTHFSNGV